MKNRNWLNVAEYGLLAGAGVGSLATAVSQQVLYSLAPMSGLFVLNVLNRQRLAAATQAQAQSAVVQLDQQVTDELAQLQKQVQVLPNFLDLASLRKAILITQQEQVQGIAAEITQLRQVRNQAEWHITQQDVHRLRENYSSLTESVGTLTSQLHRLQSGSQTEALDQAIAQLKSEINQINSALQTLSEDQSQFSTRGFQDQINHLNRRLNKLPTPVDATALQQDVDALVKMMGDVPSRRELARLTMQIEQVSQDNTAIEQSVTPLKLATTILKKQLDTLASRLSVATADLESAHPLAASTADLKMTTTALEAKLSQLSLTATPHLQAEVHSLVTTQVGLLQQQIADIQHLTQTLEQQQRHLRAVVADVANGGPQGRETVALQLDTAALHNEVRALSARVEWAETNQTDLHNHLATAMQEQLQRLLPQLPSIPAAADYELLFDLNQNIQTGSLGLGCGDRALLEQALQTAQARLIVVYPYPRAENLNGDMIGQFQRFLARGGCLDMGWGHLGDLNQRHQPRSIHSRRAIDPVGNSYLYDVLNQLTELKKQYPDRFRFKVLGTDENFLVCDRTYAVLGLQGLPTASTVFPEAALGLRTRHSDVIQGLIERFDNPVIADQDALSYFNRATTRYDLGDRQGAIADYDEVLRISPSDDVAYNNRGLVRYDLGDKRGAITDFELAIQGNPGSFVAYGNRGVLRAELGDRVGAIEDYTTALQINPDYATAYFYRGQAHAKTENKLAAIQDYSQVLRLNPENATAYFYRGLACIKMGQRLEAIRDLRQAAKMFSEQGDSQSYQQVVDTLQKLHQRLGNSG